jgi:hypothetical protein
MNPRQHKKQAKRAMRALIRDHGYRSDNFDPVRQRDDVTIDAPWDMDDRFVEARDRAKAWSGYFCPLPGTPILGSRRLDVRRRPALSYPCSRRV